MSIQHFQILNRRRPVRREMAELREDMQRREPPDAEIYVRDSYSNG